MPTKERLKKLCFDFYRDHIYNIIGAFLLFLASPPYDLFPLAFVSAFIALLSLRDMKRPFRKGFIFGLTYYLLTMYWISLVLKQYGNLPFYAAVVLMILLCMYLALYYGIFFKIYLLLRKKTSAHIFPILMSLIFVALEYLRAHILTGFPWMLIAYTQHNFIPLIQISHFASIYAISFLIMLFNLSLAEMDFRRQKPAFFNLSLSVILIILSVFYGFERVKRVNREFENRKKLKVSVIQGNIDQSQKWAKTLQKSIMDKYFNLTEKEIKKGSRLVVWPETALPFIYGSDFEMTDYFISRLSGKDYRLLAGMPHIDMGSDGKMYYTNSAGFFENAELKGKYTKTHLVPFGEYVPMKKILFFVDKLVEAAGDFLAGEELKVFEINGARIGVLICYEAIFPEISKSYMSKGVNLLINLTNDAWFGRSSAPYQHFAMTRLRAVENKVFVIRAANTGISGIIKPTGEILIKMDIFTDGSFTEEIRY